MSAIPSSLRTTFPISDGKLRTRKWKLALGSPLTWAPFLPVFGAFAFLGIGPFLFGVLCLGVTVGVAFYWRGHHLKLENQIIAALIAESNAVQDQALAGTMARLKSAGYANHTETLGRFLHQKQRIEAALLQSATTSPGARQEIETLVDKLVFGVADQLTRVAELSDRLDRPAVPLTPDRQKGLEQNRREISNQIREAWETLGETWDQLGSLLAPGDGLDGIDATHSGLDSAIAKLRHEQEIARRVRERMNADFEATQPTDQARESDSR